MKKLAVLSLLACLISLSAVAVRGQSGLSGANNQRVEELYQKAIKLGSQEKYDQAIKLFDQCLTLKPEAWDIRRQRLTFTHKNAF